MPVIGGPGSRSGTRPVGEGELLFNVRDYGAAGDGVTDDLASVNATITAVVAAGGGIVYFPPGTYLLSNTQHQTASNMGFVGAGSASVIKFATNATTPVWQFSGVTNVAVRNLTIDFGSQTFSIASLQFDGTCSDIAIEHVRFKNGKRPIIIAPNNTDVVNRVRIDHCYFDSGTTLSAVFAGGTGGAVVTDVLVSNCHVVQVGGTLGNHAFHITGATKVKVVNNVVDDTIDTSCMIIACTDVTISGNTFAQQQVGIFAGNGSHRVRIYGNDVTSPNDEGIALYDAATFGPSTELAVTGNTIHDCASTGVDVSDVNYVTITGNTIRRCGQNTGLGSVQRTGISVKINTGGANRGCNHVAITNNVVFDDAGSPKMQYGILVQTPITGLVVRGNDVSGATTTNVLWLTSGGGITITAPYYVETDAGVYNSNLTTVTLATPTATYGVGAGTSPPSLAVAGKDTSGIVFFGTGTTPTASSIIFSVTFAQPFKSAPRIVGVGNNAASNALGLYVDTGSITTTGFNVFSTNAVAASHANTYEFAWIATP